MAVLAVGGVSRESRTAWPPIRYGRVAVRCHTCVSAQDEERPPSSASKPFHRWLLNVSIWESVRRAVFVLAYSDIPNQVTL